MTYLNAYNLSDTADKNYVVAHYAANIFAAVTPSQQDDLWAIVSSSPTLMDMLWGAARSEKFEPRNASLQGDNGAYDHVKVYVDVEGVISRAGLANVAIVLAHEMAHMMQPGGTIMGETLIGIAQNPGSLPDAYATTRAGAEAVAFYVADLVRQQAMLAAPAQFPASTPNIEAFRPDAGLTGVAAINNLKAKLSAPDSAYRKSWDKEFFGEKLGFSFDMLGSTTFTANMHVTHAGNVWTGEFYSPTTRDSWQIKLTQNSDGTVSLSPNYHFQNGARSEVSRAESIQGIIANAPSVVNLTRQLIGLGVHEGDVVAGFDGAPKFCSRVKMTGGTQCRPVLTQEAISTFKAERQLRSRFLPVETGQAYI